MMLARIFSLGISLSFLDISYCQNTRPFSCVIPKLCNDAIIDPRVGPPSISVNIVNPGDLTDCPGGYIRCTNIVCGTPSEPIGDQDGPATRNSFPWQVYLQNNDPLLYAGGGVLIDQYHVLTAAHKISNVSTSMSVFLGLYNPQNKDAALSVRVSRALIHDQYDEVYLKNDVAVLRLERPVNLDDNVMTICLPSNSFQSYVTSPPTRCVVAGWGQTAFSVVDAPTQVLKQAHVPIVSADTCIQSYNDLLGAENTALYLDTDNEICAGGEAQIDACTQDGGSGLVCNQSPSTYTLTGLVLWGKDCGQPNRYGVYLNVPVYLNWITAAVQCLNNNAPACPGTILKTFS